MPSTAPTHSTWHLRRLYNRLIQQSHNAPIATQTRESKIVIAGITPDAIRDTTSSKLASTANSSLSPSLSSDQLCVHCGSSAVQIKRVTRSFGKAATLLVIEAIPMYACPDCGESYFSAQTLHEIERIKKLRKSVVVSRPVPVGAFQSALP